MIMTIIDKKKFTELSDRVLVNLSDFGLDSSQYSFFLPKGFLSTDVAFLTGHLQRGGPALLTDQLQRGAPVAGRFEQIDGNYTALVTHTSAHPSEANKDVLLKQARDDIQDSQPVTK